MQVFHWAQWVQDFTQCFLLCSLVSSQLRGIILGVQIRLQTKLPLAEFGHRFPDHYAVFKMGMMLVKANYNLYPLR